METLFAQLRVLVVDADPDDLAAARTALGALGVGHVAALPVGPAALALLDASLRYNLILCDLGTLHTAATGFIWHVRLTDADIAILAVSGGSLLADRAAMMAGADAVLHRPLTPLALKLALHTLFAARPAGLAPASPVAGKAQALPRRLQSAAAPLQSPPRPATPVYVLQAAPPDERFNVIKRRFASLYHPDSVADSSLAREARSAVFKEFWAEFERVEKAGRLPGGVR